MTFGRGGVAGVAAPGGAAHSRPRCSSSSCVRRESSSLRCRCGSACSMRPAIHVWERIRRAVSLVVTIAIAVALALAVLRPSRVGGSGAARAAGR